MRKAFSIIPTMEILLESYFLAGALQGILFLIFILVRFRLSRTTLFFGLVLTYLTFASLSVYLVLRGVSTDSLIWKGFLFLPGFIHGPALFIYVKSLLRLKPTEHFSISYIHFLPALGDLIYNIHEYLGGRLTVEEHFYHAPTFFYFLEDTQSFIYWCLAFIYFRKIRRQVEDWSSQNGSTVLSWIRSLLIMEGLLAIVFFLQNSLLLMGAELTKFSLEPFALFPPLILGICWIPLFKPERVEYLISNMNRLHYEDKHQDAAQVADAATIKIRDRLEELLDEQRIYTEPSLTLAETADMLSIPVYQLSQTINKGYDCNFLTLINRKRVEEMKNRLLETGDSVLEVGLEAGFNSKSTINLAFKKETGMTPSQFRKENSHEAG